MDKNDSPIIEQDFLHGVKVIDIGDYRVARGFTRRASSTCPHHSLVYDNQERRIWCKDCEKDVEPFDAFKGVAENFSKQTSVLQKRENKINEAEQHNLISLAAKVIDEAWRRKKMIPCCPHCNAGLMPEDFKGGIIRSTGREYELARRKTKEQNDNR